MNDKNPYIDYSQHRNWMFCPAFWYEKTVDRRQMPYKEGQREDPLAIGSMVHEGLRVWSEQGKVEIPPAIVEEIGPTKGAYDASLQMVQGYAMTYPEEEWEVSKCEAPLRFPVIDGYDGLAKVDQYFWNRKEVSLPQGLEGEQITLSPGWWVREYKTKNPDIPVGLWMQSWLTNLQASYQVLALKHMLEEKSSDPVQGVLVTVIEKPKLFIPRRRCKQCNELYEYYSWIPKGEQFACPICGNVQTLQKLKEDPVETPPRYWRMVVTRDRYTLDNHFVAISTVASQMKEMRVHGLYNWPWTFLNCVDPALKRKCQYFEHHTYGNSTLEDPTMVEVPDYVKEEV